MEIVLLGQTGEKRLINDMKIVSSAGRISRMPGTALDVISKAEDVESNIKLIRRIIGMGHESISEHQYFCFAISGVTPVIEQTLIEEKFYSATIKSRREVDYSLADFYTPTFHNHDGEVMKNNKELTALYNKHMTSLFNKYSTFLEREISKEDARFILPYCFKSEIIMGFDARTAKNIILSFTKGKNSKIDELRTFGEKLKQILLTYAPYFDTTIDKAETKENLIEKYLKDYNILSSTKIPSIDKVNLVSCTKEPDTQILVSSLMKHYHMPYDIASKKLKELSKTNEEFEEELMKQIYLNGGEELSQADFTFELGISYASLTHLTRHRTTRLIISDFVPNMDLTTYKIPSAIKRKVLDEYQEVYRKNKEVYDSFKEQGVREEDLIYFHLAGNMPNIKVSMDGKTFAWISRLRICTKAQWEIRGIVTEMRELVKKEAPVFASVLGPDCEIKHVCGEGKESCGKINVYLEKV